MNELPEILQDRDSVVLGDAYYLEDMPNDLYHNCPGLSSSTARRFAQSQEHALHEEMLESAALRFGTAAHALIVEGEDAFNKEIACINGSMYTKANKELKEDYEKRGYTVISKADRDTIFEMREALIPEGDKLLHPNEDEFPGVFGKPYERALFWYEKDLLLKVKADVLRYPLDPTFDSNSIILGDYKTTSECSVYGFTKSVRNYQYDLQAAWYKRAFERAGFKVEGFYFVAQEKKKPYATKIFKMSDRDMESGWIYLEGVLSHYRGVVIDGDKPSIYNSPNIIELNLTNKGEKNGS